MCLYGQACYFGQVVYNSYKVSGSVSSVMPWVFHNPHFSFKSTNIGYVSIGKMENRLHVCLGKKEKKHYLCIKKYFDMAKCKY